MGIIPQPFVLLLPGLVVAISGWLEHAQMPAWLNAIISGIVVLLCAALWALFTNSLAGDYVADIVLIAGYCAALMAGPLAPLHRWLIARLPSPLEVFAPLKPAPVPPRASSLPPGQLWSIRTPYTPPSSAVPPPPPPSNLTAASHVDTTTTPAITGGEGHSV